MAKDRSGQVVKTTAGGDRGKDIKDANPNRCRLQAGNKGVRSNPSNSCLALDNWTDLTVYECVQRPENTASGKSSGEMAQQISIPRLVEPGIAKLGTFDIECEVQRHFPPTSMNAPSVIITKEEGGVRARIKIWGQARWKNIEVGRKYVLVKATWDTKVLQHQMNANNYLHLQVPSATNT